MTDRMSRRVSLLLLALALVAVACGGDGDGAGITTIATTGATQAPSDVPDEIAMDDEGEMQERGTATAEAQATDAGEASASGTYGSVAFGLDPVDPLSVSGDVAVAGSSTVFPLAEAMAARFEDEGYSGLITIDSVGSGAGFERFCVAGESDVSNASRPIRDAEVESCQAIGRDPIEFRVGTDALAVTVSPGNTFANDLTVEELAVLFSTATTWQDVRADFPANPIQRFIPGTDSGTFDYFVEEVFDEDEGPILVAGNTQLSEDDNVLVQGISGDGCDPSNASTICAVGFFGYAYYSENSDRLSVLNIEGIEPTTASVTANTYPLARPLFMYSTASIIAEKPQVGAFLSFVLQFVNEEIGEVGYFPAPDAVLQAAADELGAAL
ncbi:MAG: PstS family phosphate ABC transporter substrate-binding protein [bacterium]|nr:PstS family phosphate ABC transporter substrate-binding protein [bacterium]